MANYLTTDTDLTTVANAIRTKGGTTDPLSFPSGFAAAIADIPSGSGAPTGMLVTVDLDCDTLVGPKIGSITINCYGTNNYSGAATPDTDAVIKSKTFSYDIGYDGVIHMSETLEVSAEELQEANYDYFYIGLVALDMPFADLSATGNIVWTSHNASAIGIVDKTNAGSVVRVHEEDRTTFKKASYMVKRSNGWSMVLPLLLPKSIADKGYFTVWNHYNWED